MTLNKFSNTLNVTQMRLPATILVPTFPDKKDEEELDLQSLTEEDLKLLKKTDPFLYYSIPAVNKAALSLKKVDHSKASQSQSTKLHARSDLHLSAIRPWQWMSCSSVWERLT
ncbi:hypothetical protein QTG54_002848 [Skeletonema marinoi]|uniref:Uncharacterized protein n=1 Tax=Skeletonema marinoi TaxID=267567 RepID=A0AAD8YGS5_9STRA|nr:hypothetical protein QTG54_002848 [Skeletonema marinoi]